MPILRKTHKLEALVRDEDIVAASLRDVGPRIALGSASRRDATTGLNPRAIDTVGNSDFCTAKVPRRATK